MLDLVQQLVDKSLLNVEGKAEGLPRLAETAAPFLEGAQQKEWLDRCQTEVSNLRVAFQWFIRAAHPDAGGRMGHGALRFIEIFEKDFLD